MNLLRKYYDKESTGGGIPDEVKDVSYDMYPDDLVSEHGISYPSVIQLKKRIAFSEGYSLASEEISRLKIALKDVTKAFKSNVVYEKHEFSPAYLELLKEISRLKEDNERLRGELDRLDDGFSDVLIS